MDSSFPPETKPRQGNTKPKQECSSTNEFLNVAEYFCLFKAAGKILTVEEIFRQE